MSNITFYDRSLSLPHYLTISGSTGVPPSTLPSTTGSNRTNHSPVKHVASPTRSSASTTDGNLLIMILIPAFLVLIAVICLFGYLVICRKRSTETASAQVQHGSGYFVLHASKETSGNSICAYVRAWPSGQGAALVSRRSRVQVLLPATGWICLRWPRIQLLHAL